MKQSELHEVAQIHKQVFARQRMSFEWLECNFNAFPRFLFYVISSEAEVGVEVGVEVETEILGYIIWSQKSGFRPQAIMELEQIAILPSHQGKGVGTQLIQDSLKLVKTQLKKQDSVLKHITVSTRVDNAAQRLYKKELGAVVEATITNLYSADEVFMVARNV
ncbi:MAG: GNAT family N-acetyltransferase [Saccharospirillaceae bacterium]|nr:GNAT family N-acetyltransferase [Saccharospirillaceae bacterium]